MPSSSPSPTSPRAPIAPPLSPPNSSSSSSSNSSHSSSESTGCREPPSSRRDLCYPSAIAGSLLGRRATIHDGLRYIERRLNKKKVGRPSRADIEERERLRISKARLEDELRRAKDRKGKRAGKQPRGTKRKRESEDAEEVRRELGKREEELKRERLRAAELEEALGLGVRYEGEEERLREEVERLKGILREKERECLGLEEVIQEKEMTVRGLMERVGELEGGEEGKRLRHLEGKVAELEVTVRRWRTNARRYEKGMKGVVKANEKLQEKVKRVLEKE